MCFNPSFPFTKTLPSGQDFLERVVTLEKAPCLVSVQLENERETMSLGVAGEITSRKGLHS